MPTLRVYPESINTRHIAQAADVLAAGGVIIYPTDTIYALCCDALNARAVERLCRIKGVDADRRVLSLVCADMSMASTYARIDNRAFRIMHRYLPGAVTFILPPAPALPKVVKGRKSVGVRVPDNAVAQAIIRRLQHPLLSTSVAGLDDDEIIYADSLALAYGAAVDLVIDGGDGDTVPSTVVDLTDSTAPEIIRQGKVSVEL